MFEFLVFVVQPIVVIWFIFFRCRHRFYVHGTTKHMALQTTKEGKKIIFWDREHLKCSKCGKMKRGRKIDKYNKKGI